jgi:hypothetical protein
MKAWLPKSNASKETILLDIYAMSDIYVSICMLILIYATLNIDKGA